VRSSEASLGSLIEVLPSKCSRWERGFRIPGCLTSEDEERETWTAESLRISKYLKASAFNFRDRTKDFGGTRFEKGYTMISSLRSGRQRCESPAI
jgi:hypothetical protein